MKRNTLKELRVRLPNEDLWLLRMKASKQKVSLTQYLSSIAKEEKKEERRNDYKLF